MRHVIKVLSLLIVLGLYMKAQAQNPSFSCDIISQTVQSTSSTIHYGGEYITSTGVLRVLVIFLRFAGDTETSANWPNPAILSEWAQHFVDTANSPTGNYYQGTISQYFYQNSYGKLHIIGDVYYVTTDSSEDYFHRYAYSHNGHEARSIIETEIFNKLDSPPYNVDFRLYDHWTFGNYNHSNSPDAVLDMCWLITRNIHFNINARFDIGWAELDCPTLSKDGIIIQTGFPGSGIGIFEDHINRPVNASVPPWGRYPIVNQVAHEMTHYFFGYNHFADMSLYLDMTHRRTSSSLRYYAGGWEGVYSGYEKWRLGWLQPTTITANSDNVALWDLATTSDSTKNRLLKIDIPGTNQFFLIENRSWISPFEARYSLYNEDRGLLRPGILVYHIIQEDDWLAATQVQKIDADGRFRWKMVYHGSNPNDMTDDVIDKDVSDRVNGYSETEAIHIAGYSSEKWTAEYHPNASNPYSGGPYKGCIYYTDKFTECQVDHGDSLDIYQIGDVISPWSNPGSHQWNGTAFAPTTIGMQILSFNPANQTYTLAVRLTNAQELAPSKPQDVLAIFSNPSSVSITWSANTEPDISGYDLYRSIYYDGATLSYTKVNSSLLTSPTFTDNPSIPGGIPANKDIYWRYNVKAKDNQGNYSVPSKDFWLYVGKTVSGTISR